MTLYALFRTHLRGKKKKAANSSLAASGGVSAKDNAGRVYQPTAWQGSEPGGHHRKGVLEFPKLEENTDSITLIIKGIANVPERIFMWPVER